MEYYSNKVIDGTLPDKRPSLAAVTGWSTETHAPTEATGNLDQPLEGYPGSFIQQQQSERSGYLSHQILTIRDALTVQSTTWPHTGDNCCCYQRRRTPYAIVTTIQTPIEGFLLSRLRYASLERPNVTTPRLSFQSLLTPAQVIKRKKKEKHEMV